MGWNVCFVPETVEPQLDRIFRVADKAVIRGAKKISKLSRETSQRYLKEKIRKIVGGAGKDTLGKELGGYKEKG